MSLLRYRASTLTLVALVLAACSESPVTPIRAAGGPALRSATGSGGNLVANSHRYRQQTYVHASNRSGSASLAGRALLGKNGNTVLEVTTGQIGGAAGPGNISKLQIKLLDPNGMLQSTYNLNGLTGGTQTTNVPGRAAHSKIQVQGNVRDIDPKRTDVVTITERVNRRPDVAVQNLSAPEETRPNAIFLVGATLAELNGDVGATTNCVLSVDGVEKDRAEGVWIAEGDAVSCAFNASIADVGTHSLTVKAESVNPGDWDTANNSASRDILVRSPEVPLHGRAYAYDYSYNSGYHNFGNWTRYNSLERYVWDGEGGYKERYQYAYLYSYASGVQVTFPLTAANFDLTSGGNPVASVTLANTQSWWGDANYGCQYMYSANGNDYLQVCAYGNGYAYVYAGHWAGRAVYYSRGFSDYTDWNGQYYHNEWNYEYNYWWYSNTNVVDFGSTLEFNVRVETANQVLTASPVVSWNQYDYSWDYGYGPFCNDYDDPYYYGYRQHYCYQYIYNGRQRSGYTDF